MSGHFATHVQRVATRVKAVTITLTISEDDYEAVEAVPADPETGEPAIPASLAHTDTMYNSFFKFDILDQNGDVLEHREGEFAAGDLTSGEKGKATALMNVAMGLAKAAM
jgi:hypothetical protein